MDSILEQQRNIHEEIEQLELAITKELGDKTKTHKDKVLRDSRIWHYLNLIEKCTGNLSLLYEDKNGVRKSEIESLKVNQDLGEFYKRYKIVKDQYKNVTEVPADVMDVTMKKAERAKHAEDVEMAFSGEENFGKYLDLHELYNLYLNLGWKNGINNMDYISFIEKYDAFELIPPDIKSSSRYKQYIDKLFEYLKEFVRRSKPLDNIDHILFESEKEFNRFWDRKGHPINSNIKGDDELFCSACVKHFSKKSVYDAHLSGKKHQIATSKLNSNPNVDLEKLKLEKHKERIQKEKYLAYLEFVIKKISLVVLPEIRNETKASLERKQTLTLEELEMRGAGEKEEDIVVEDTESEDEERQQDDKFYNPLKLPIGWDGKPIPFWLYKLHGLGKEYSCEICGNFVYMGRRAFERHFQESRHAYGMKCLQIPNTLDFQEITKISDAITLWDKIRAKTRAETFQQEMMEEFEDINGNVYNKKTFEDLKRQGVL